jgi:hypothetical protein
MKYFIDTEFIEGTQNKTFLGINIGKTKPTIDLISIGIVSEAIEDKSKPFYLGSVSNPYEKLVYSKISREYYAISKNFNLKEAWNRWEQRTGEGDKNNTEPRLYWIRENVLRPIFNELVIKEKTKYKDFTKNNLEYLINKYGKTNKQIAEEIKEFCLEVPRIQKYGDPEFYAYGQDKGFIFINFMKNYGSL